MSLSRLQSVSFRTCIFFARNPDECLTSSDIAAKYDVPSNAVRPHLHYAVQTGLLRRENTLESHKYVYTAGPVLREMVGAS